MKFKSKFLMLLAVVIVAANLCTSKVFADEGENRKENPIDYSKILEDTKITAFKLEASNNPQLKYDIEGYWKDNVIYCFVPSGVDKSKLVGTFEKDGHADILVGDVVQESGITSNDFSNKVIYKVADSRNVTYSIEVVNSSVPTIEIETESKQTVESKDNYLNGTMRIVGTDNYKEGLYEGSIRIKGRGNSTWKYEKKPYKIKLDRKSNVLGMDSSKDWVLLANHVDKTLIRNSVVFELAQRFNLQYTPDFVYVDVILNGEYLGNYTLCEQIKIGNGRVDINKLSKDDNYGEAVTGGYLLEIDNHKDEDVWFESSLGLPIAIKGPEEITDPQKKYIINYINEFEAALNSDSFSYNGKRYDEYIDVDSFVNWYLVNEITKNVDSKGYSSIYLYKDKNGKLSIGPVWDYDRAFGNINYDGCDEFEGWWVKEGTWYSKMFQDTKFVNLVKNRYEEMMPVINDIVNMMDRQANTVSSSRIVNYTRWDITDKLSIHNPVATGSYESEMNHLKNWTSNRISWMNSELGNVDIKQLIGLTRYETAALLSKSEFASADTVILVNGYALVDGLTAAPLASCVNGPILLTEQNDISEVTREEIKRLGAKNVVIVGGTTVVGSNVENELKSMGIANITRLGGITRYETSLLIAKYIDANYKDVSSVFICDGMGEADSMSVASVSAENKNPIILVSTGEINSDTYNWLKSENLRDAYTIGGTSAVSDYVLNLVNSVTSENILGKRLGGINRYETNAKVINEFYGNNINNVYVSKGYVLVDALTSGPIAAINKSPIVLAGDNLEKEQIDVLSSKKANVIIQAGGGVSSQVINNLSNILK